MRFASAPTLQCDYYPLLLFLCNNCLILCQVKRTGNTDAKGLALHTGLSGNET
ncbi:MAG: hypothetical protein HOP11_00620 [Saprospiraceae bacterium]|nr:hypothetical protein [Saprospiraceae bacterium]